METKLLKLLNFYHAPAREGAHSIKGARLIIVMGVLLPVIASINQNDCRAEVVPLVSEPTHGAESNTAISAVSGFYNKAFGDITKAEMSATSVAESIIDDDKYDVVLVTVCFQRPGGALARRHRWLVVLYNENVIISAWQLQEATVEYNASSRHLNIGRRCIVDMSDKKSIRSLSSFNYGALFRLGVAVDSSYAVCDSLLSRITSHRIQELKNISIFALLDPNISQGIGSRLVPGPANGMSGLARAFEHSPEAKITDYQIEPIYIQNIRIPHLEYSNYWECKVGVKYAVTGSAKRYFMTIIITGHTDTEQCVGSVRILP